jgi:predicted ATPase
MQICEDSTIHRLHTHANAPWQVPKAVIASRMARFSFDALCGQPLGAADYGAVAAAFHTVFITHVPRMTLDDINRARRFITLVSNSHLLREVQQLYI